MNLARAIKAAVANVRQVWDCASPLALSERTFGKHPTSNIQHRTTNGPRLAHWMLGVGWLDVFQAFTKGAAR
jgi:hypothetical protein